MNPKPTSPELVTKWDRMSERERKYSCLMGNSEMETAVEVMEKIAAGRDFGTLRVNPTHFVRPQDATPGRQPSGALIGFSLLVYHGWLEADYPNGDFVPSDALIDRLNKRWGTDYRYVESIMANARRKAKESK